MTDARKEFPDSWFAKAKLSAHRDPACNYFGVDASQPLSEWRRKGWIHPDDPRGWFPWYCRYYMGRRLPDEDRRQIARWRAVRRHVAQLRRNCDPGDFDCRRRQRQALLTGLTTAAGFERKPRRSMSAPKRSPCVTSLPVTDVALQNSAPKCGNHGRDYVFPHWGSMLDSTIERKAQ